MKKILLIEKDDSIRSNLAQVLQLVNYEVHTAQDGNEAADLAMSMLPDLIICGAFLPLLEGFSLLQKLQNNPACKKSQVMFYTPKSENGNGHVQEILTSSIDLGQQIKQLEIINAFNERVTKVEPQDNVQIKFESTKGIGSTTLAALLQDRDVSYYKKKQVVFSEGNCARNLYFIKKGKIKTYQTNDYGKQLVVDLHSENDFIGYVPLIENTNYSETAEALEDTELVHIPKSDFNNIIKQNPDVMRLFFNLLTKSVSAKNNQMVGLAYNSLRKKVAEALLTICKKYNAENLNDFIIDINRESLAAIAGTATESLVRTLTEFKGEKLIDIKNSYIRILDQKKLECLSN